MDRWFSKRHTSIFTSCSSGWHLVDGGRHLCVSVLGQPRLGSVYKYLIGCHGGHWSWDVSDREGRGGVNEDGIGGSGFQKASESSSVRVRFTTHQDGNCLPSIPSSVGCHQGRIRPITNAHICDMVQGLWGKCWSSWLWWSLNISPRSKKMYQCWTLYFWYITTMCKHGAAEISQLLICCQNPGWTRRLDSTTVNWDLLCVHLLNQDQVLAGSLLLYPNWNLWKWNINLYKIFIWNAKVQDYSYHFFWKYL